MSTIRKIAAPSRRRDGQILVTLVTFLVALILVLGLVIDAGFAYVTRASLSKAVDAASLTGARNLSFGREKGEALARASFADNYPRGGRDVADPTVDVTFTMDDNHNTLINVAATTTINTFFIRILPQWKTLSVTSRGQAVRVRVLMMMVLDRSGSLGPISSSGNGGGAALPGAVADFIDQFDDENDRVGLASFASTATTDPNSPYVSIAQSFKSNIKNAADLWSSPGFVKGRTFTDGGLTLSKNALQGVTLADGENVSRVVVLFTDGYANTFQDTFDCPPSTVYNFGASDPPYRTGALINPTTGDQTGCYSLDLDVQKPACCPVASFNSISGQTLPVNWNNVWTEGQLRALATARAMRTDKDAPVTFYVIGLGNELNQNFLRSIANDPSAPDYDPNQPEGAAVFALTADQLRSVFQSIASKILLRLTS